MPLVQRFLILFSGSRAGHGIYKWVPAQRSLGTTVIERHNTAIAITWAPPKVKIHNLSAIDELTSEVPLYKRQITRKHLFQISPEFHLNLKVRLNFQEIRNLSISHRTFLKGLDCQQNLRYLQP